MSKDKKTKSKRTKYPNPIEHDPEHVKNAAYMLGAIGGRVDLLAMCVAGTGPVDYLFEGKQYILRELSELRKELDTLGKLTVYSTSKEI